MHQKQNILKLGHYPWTVVFEYSPSLPACKHNHAAAGLCARFLSVTAFMLHDVMDSEVNHHFTIRLHEFYLFVYIVSTTFVIKHVFTTL